MVEIVRLFARPLPIDQVTLKATAINLIGAGRPYMRAFHFSWLSFMVAFFGWFAIAPLMPSIKDSLKLSKENRNDSNTISVSSTILFRVVAGLLCDRLGPKRVMGIILVLGAIPVGLAGLAHDLTSFLILRFFIGALGATFVPCQFWTMQMFGPNAVGSANAIVGGWGNMGAGVTYLVMPVVFDGFKHHFGSADTAWRVTLVIPAIIIFIVGLCDLLFTDDCPQGKWEQRNDYSQNNGNLPVKEVHDATEKKSEVINDVDSEKNIKVVPHVKPGLEAYIRALLNPNVIILVFMYACSFGVELAVDNAIGSFYHEHFHLTQTKADLIGSIFGLMNIFSRASGGFISDILFSKYSIRGRLFFQFFILFCEGVFLAVYKYSLHSVPESIIILVLFSYFVQACCGTTYAIVPFVDPPIVGTISGIIGAGGNVGGLVWSYVFRTYTHETPKAFFIIGLCVLGISFTTFFLKVQGRMLIEFNRKK
ncbi:7148_t:CDS:2 [Diversispora eburnea]|uniref:Nitrate/nitrite transporter n=1 Tax=Diversispora eburnea TaxID=1213867 RepID=A0A9N8V499_9GLOM|nr:7148_t:CDS:2 [Diversispora eburnea]